MKHILLLFLLFSIFSSHAQELLPADKAFAFKAKVAGDKILLNWDIAKGYYLYKEKIEISADNPAYLGKAIFPVAKIKNDEFFGKVGVYRNKTQVVVPMLENDAKSVVLTVVFQGCADLGVCYPPITKSTALRLENTQTSSFAKGMLNVFSKARSTMQSMVEKVSISNDPLLADQAFVYSVKAIDANTLRATWKVHPEYYLYHDKFFIDVKGAKLGDIDFPKGEIKNDELFGKVEVHKDRLQVIVPLTQVNAKSVVLTARYQGCWLGGICYPPIEKVTNIVLPKLQKKATIASIKTQENSKSNTTGTTLLNEADEINALLQQGDVLKILGWFFVLGLLLSLTPCVFPMIPILSSIIVGQKEKTTTRRALIMSITFVLAMSVTYSIAGVLAGYFGSNLQVLFQTPWILVIFSAIFVALAFSMFGFYDIQLPASLQNKLTNASNKQKNGNLIGVAIMGFLSALIVGPCVAPPIAGALIYIGNTGDALLGGLSLFTMSLGMGVPLLIIGSGVSKLPKAGQWMNNIKYVFGILMLAMAIWLLERIISPYVALILWAFLFTLSPIAMGALNSLSSTSLAWHRIFKGIGLIVLIYGVLLWGLVARGGGDMLAPLSGYNENSQVEKAQIAFKKIKSSADLDRILAQAQRNQVVMLDFYADWCISCKEIERFVFLNTEVVSHMKNVIALKADVTKNDVTDKELMKRFDVIGPPGILFFKNNIENRSQRIIGEIDAQGFLKHLNANFE